MCCDPQFMTQFLKEKNYGVPIMVFPHALKAVSTVDF